jgi:hypothetical protein
VAPPDDSNSTDGPLTTAAPPLVLPHDEDNISGTPAPITLAPAPRHNVTAAPPRDNSSDSNNSSNAAFVPARAQPLSAALNVAPATARAIVRSAYASSAAAGLVSPTGATKATTMARVGRLAQCTAFAISDDDDWPDWANFVFAFQLTPVSDDDARGKRLSAAAGALVTTGGFALVVALLLLGLVVAGDDVIRPARYVAVLLALMLTYYAPNVTEAAITVLRFTDNSTQRVCACVSLGATSLITLVCFFRVWQRFTPPPPAAVAGGGALGTPEEPWQRVLRPFWGSGRDVTLLSHRLLVFEDMAVAHVVAAIVGWRPSDLGECRGLSIALVAVGVAHMGFLLYVRPYASRLELGLSVVMAGFTVATGVSSVVALLMEESENAGKALGWVMLASDAAVWMQLIVLTGAAVKEHLEKQSQHAANAAAAANHAVPLLTVPPVAPPAMLQRSGRTG